MELTELTCRRCGGSLQPNGNYYKCDCCGKFFEKEQTVNVANELRKVLNEQKQEMVANLRRQLWAEMHAQYIHSAKIVELAREIKKYLPEDYFANFCEIANSGNVKQVNYFLNNTTKEQMDDYADIVLNFMLISAKVGNLTAISLFIEKAYKNSPTNYDTFATVFEKTAERVKSGIYTLNITRDVFLAYSSADVDKVIELCDYLEGQGISCFMALRNLRHGRGAVDNYDSALKQAIDNCRTVVFVSSKNSRSLSCDALTKELPYIKQKDLENSPAEFKYSYDKLPQDYMLPRVEYLIEDYCGDVAEHITKEFFHNLEWCKNKEAVASRIATYLTEDRSETARQKAEREKNELQLKLAQAQLALNTTQKNTILNDLTAENFNGTIKYCKKCKTPNKINTNFCSSCGSNEFIKTYEEYLATKIKFCKSCGTKNNVENKFCEKCGGTQFLPTYAEYTAYQQRLKEEEERKKREAEEERIRKEKLAEAAARKAEEERIRKQIEEKQRKRKKRIILTTIIIALSSILASMIFYFIPEVFIDVTYEENGVAYRLRGASYLNTERYIVENYYYYGNATVEILDSFDGIPVIQIGDRAFYNCSSLKSITIPDSVTSIGSSAFYGCSRLTSITFEGTKAQWNAIEKGSGWNYYTGKYTVHCSNGDIAA